MTYWSCFITCLLAMTLTGLAQQRLVARLRREVGWPSTGNGNMYRPRPLLQAHLAQRPQSNARGLYRAAVVASVLFAFVELGILIAAQFSPHTTLHLIPARF